MIGEECAIACIGIETETSNGLEILRKAFCIIQGIVKYASTSATMSVTACAWEPSSKLKMIHVGKPSRPSDSMGNLLTFGC